jgi:hypothetical protein
MFETNADNVVTKCTVRYQPPDVDLDDWTNSGEHRFYFERFYDPEHKTCSKPEKEFREYGKGRGEDMAPCLFV